MKAETNASHAHPFAGGKFRLTMGLMPIAECDWLEAGPTLGDTLAAKRILLETRHDEVFQALPESDAPAAELLGLVAAHLSRHHGTKFRRERDALFNAVTGERWDLAGSPLHPLDLAGRLVTEDLCLLRRAGDRHVLVGASLCAPAHWRLAEKLGRPLSAIHAPVPGYEEALGTPVERLLAGLKAGRIVGRFNWGIADDPEPFQPSAETPPARLTEAEVGEKLWLRVERQTLRRLPNTGAVVFTIGTHITRLDRAIDSAAEARDLASAIAGMPEEMRVYKRIAPVAGPLLAWLAAIA